MSAPSEETLRVAMRSAIEVSEAARGTTSPNPPVGCVVLDADGEVVGRGATRPPGGPHAEIVALRAAGISAAGGTAVVTLEPCSHTGRTPPCTEALREAGVARVVYAASDPTLPSSGAAALRASGIDVHSGLMSEVVTAGPLRAWTHFARTGRPHVTWKYAATMDGRTAAADGTSRWISSETSRAEVHQLRRQVDAIVVGTGTALADDPHLTARDERGQLLERQPLRVVVGSRSLPAGAKLLDDAAETVQLDAGPAAVLDELAGRGVVDVLLEGGAALAGGFVAADRVDRVLAYIAPALLGAGPAALGESGVGSISQAWWLDVEKVSMSGSDVRVSAVRRAR